MTTNKELWQRVCVTDPKAVKPITGKQYQGNSPKPYWIVERLTEEFGPCGIGWGFTILNERMERLTETDVLHVAVVNFWYVMGDKRGELQQIGQTKAVYRTKNGSTMVDEDAPKKSVTDALIKCASYLGFAGDIFAGRWDDSKYVEWAAKQYDNAPDKPNLHIVTGARDGIGDNLPEDWKVYLRDLADEASEYVKQGNLQAALDAIHRDKLDDEQMTFLHNQLDSKTRSAIKTPQKAKQ